jgi:enoyl-CoA hydratase/carnithine racemase
VRDAAAGRLGQLKFIAFDFAHPGDEEAMAGKGFDALVTDLADLILHAPVVSVGYARGSLSGADLELALACSMLVGEECARFSFAADPVSSVRTYGFLARKIGFVRAERLMERGEVLDAAQMRDLFLLKDVVKGGAGLAGLDQFLRHTLRRHNSAYGIYRAQRIATSSALAPGARS